MRVLNINNNYNQNEDDINQIKAAFITNKVPYNWLVKSKKFVNTNLNLMVYLKTLNAEREYLNDLVTECKKTMLIGPTSTDQYVVYGKK